MTWFKVDDKFHSHSKVRKVLAEEPAALALWVVAGSWSSDNTTDGLIPDHQLPWLIPSGAEELAQRLVAARLWKRVRGGYQFHEWTADGDGTKRNPTREEVEEQRRKKAEAGRKGGLNSGKTRTRRKAPAEAPAEARASPVVEPPTRPDPPPSKEGGEGSVRHASRGAAHAPHPVAHSPNGHGLEDPDALAQEQAEIAAAAEAKVAAFNAQQRRNHERAAEARAAIRRPTAEPRRDAMAELRQLTPGAPVFTDLDQPSETP